MMKHQQLEHQLLVEESIPASFKQRYLAMTIDQILLTAIAAFLMQALAGGHGAGRAININVWTTVIYYVLTQWQFGATLGKKIMKCQVISTRGELGLGQLVLRETIGRFVSLASFCVGYLAMLFRVDGACWHDSMSGTRVVSTDPDAEQTDLRKALFKVGLSASFCVALVGVMIYGAFFSSLPVKYFCQQLEVSGMEIQNPHGSLARGIRIDRLSSGDQDIKFTLQDVKIHLDLAALLKKKLVINELAVNGGEIGLPDVVAPFFQAKPKQQQGPEPAPNPQQEQAQGKSQIESVAIKRIDFSKVKFTYGGFKTINLERFYVDNLLIDKSGALLSRLWIQGDLINLDVNQLKASKETLALLTLKGQVKKDLLPKYLGDIDFEGTLDFEIQTRKFNKLSLGVCGRRLQVHNEGSGFVLRAYDWDPSVCLNTSVPVHRISAEIQLLPPKFAPEVKNARLQVRNTPFEWVSGYGFVHKNGGQYFAFDVNSAALLQTVLGREPVFPIRSWTQDSREWLAHLYYDKAVSQLSADENDLTQKDLVFFHTELDSNRTPATTGP